MEEIQTPIRKKYILININSNALQYLDDIKKEIKKYQSDYSLIYTPICTGRTDNDERYFEVLKEDFPTLERYDRTNNLEDFFTLIWWAERIINTRLHLFLISSYMGVENIVFPYQKKITKMQQVLKEMKI